MSRRLKPPRLPRIIETLSRRARKLNPWGYGESLGLLLDAELYYDIQRILEAERPEGNCTLDLFINEVSELPRIKDWCIAHHLASHHVISTLVKEGVI